MKHFSTRETLQSAAAATGNGTPMHVAGFVDAVLQLTGTFTATVTFEGTVDGSTYSAVVATDISSATETKSSTATAAGLYRVNTGGLAFIRARVSAYTSGNVTVVAQAQTR